MWLEFVSCPNTKLRSLVEWSTLDLPELKTQTLLIMAYIKELGFPFQSVLEIVQLFKTVAYILRFKDNCSKYTKKQGTLKLSEFKRASSIWIKISQHQSFLKNPKLNKGRAY